MLTANIVFQHYVTSNDNQPLIPAVIGLLTIGRFLRYYNIEEYAHVMLITYAAAALTNFIVRKSNVFFFLSSN